jgi:hypothetical protein
MGPEGFAIDWHGVRAVYSVIVDDDARDPGLVEAGGSTAEARWFSEAELRTVAVTEVTTEALRMTTLRR